ncbi:MAG: hypothetical protein ACR2KV_00795 [Solirubrobacteraceae bacterium]
MRPRDIGVLLVLAGAVVVVLVLALSGGGGGGVSPAGRVAAIAASVVPGASAVLGAPAEPAPGAQGLRIVLPDRAIHPPPGGPPLSRNSTAASVYAGAGWRGALIAAVAATEVQALTDFIVTDRAGAQAPGAAFYLDGSVRPAPGQNPAAGMTMLDRVSPAAALRQLDDNLLVLMRGLPAGSVTGMTVTEVPVDRGRAGFAVELRVADLQRLTHRFGDIFAGVGTGLAPGPASTVEGLAIHAVDPEGRNAGSWMATRAQQGTTVADPRLRLPRAMVPRLHFTNETGGPAALPSAHA